MPAFARRLQQDVAQAEQIVARIDDLIIEVDPDITAVLVFEQNVICLDVAVILPCTGRWVTSVMRCCRAWGFLKIMALPISSEYSADQSL